MAFKLTLFVCGLVLSAQNAYSQVLPMGYSYGNGFGSSYAAGYGDVDITAIDIDATGYGAAYSNGYGVGNALGLGSAGLGIGNAVGLGAAGFGVGNAVGIGSAGVGLAGAGLAGVGLGGIAANPSFITLNSYSGGVLPITSIGPIVPAGITVVSDNVIEGTVAVQGQLPFLSAVAFDGTLPSAGSGLTQCGCGTAGNIGIISETVGNAGPVAGGLGGLLGRNGILY